MKLISNEYIEVVYRLAQIEAIKIDVEGYKAFNSTRIDRDMVHAYGEDTFIEAANNIREIAKELLTFRTEEGVTSETKES